MIDDRNLTDTNSRLATNGGRSGIARVMSQMANRFSGLLLIVSVLTTSIACAGPASTPTTSLTRTPATSQAAVDRKYVYAGFPRPTTTMPVTILRNEGYVVGYSETKKEPLWAAYRVYKVDHAGPDPRPRGFIVDERTEAKVQPAAYTRSGYDRGHMAPNHAIDKFYGQSAQRETFLMSNICPQAPKLNRQLWQRLEALIADDYAERFSEAWVTVGPIFGENGDHLQAGVEIPKAFFCIIEEVEKGKPRALAFIIKQDVEGSEKLNVFLVSIRRIEQQTGLDFNPDLDRASDNELEEETANDLW